MGVRLVSCHRFLEEFVTFFIIIFLLYTSLGPQKKNLSKIHSGIYDAWINVGKEVKRCIFARLRRNYRLSIYILSRRRMRDRVRGWWERERIWVEWQEDVGRGKKDIFWGSTGKDCQGTRYFLWKFTVIYRTKRQSIGRKGWIWILGNGLWVWAVPDVRGHFVLTEPR